MSIFRRLFGGAAEPGANGAHASADASAPDTATVRRIVSQLEAMPPDRARYLAAASYVLARVANSDLVISPEETSFMERTLVKESAIGEAEAVLVVEAAKQQARLFGSTEDYLVTREFKAISTMEERERLLRCFFLVLVADDEIDATESWLANRLAEELDIERPDLNAIREEFHDQLSGVRELRQLQQAPQG